MLPSFTNDHIVIALLFGIQFNKYVEVVFNLYGDILVYIVDW